eukprot:tig00020592_g11648.t1
MGNAQRSASDARGGDRANDGSREPRAADAMVADADELEEDPPLLRLPEGLLEAVIMLLHHEDVASLHRTCRRMRAVVEDMVDQPELAARYYRRAFGDDWRAGTKEDIRRSLLEYRDSTLVECLATAGADQWVHATNGKYCIIQEYRGNVDFDYVLHSMNSEPAARRRVRHLCGSSYCDITWFTGVKGQKDVVWYLTKEGEGGLPQAAHCFEFESGAPLSAFDVYLPSDPPRKGAPLLLLDYHVDSIVVAVQSSTLIAVLLSSPPEARLRSADGVLTVPFPPAAPAGSREGGWFRLSGAALLPKDEEVRLVRERVVEDWELPESLLRGTPEGAQERVFFSSGAHYFLLTATEESEEDEEGERAAPRDVRVGFFAWRDGADLHFDFPEASGQSERSEYRSRPLHFSENGNRVLVLDLPSRSPYSAGLAG